MGVSLRVRIHDRRRGAGDAGVDLLHTRQVRALLVEAPGSGWQGITTCIVLGRLC